VPVDSIAVNLAHACVTEGVNGPGRRFTVWVQGCPLSCPGCFNPDLQPFVPRRPVAPDDLAREAEEVLPWEGVTLSGGEPFAQAAALARFLRVLRTRVGRRLPVLAFSGHPWPELRAGPEEWQDLLGLLDLLVDGPYHRDSGPGPPLRASANQTLVPLSAAGQILAREVEAADPSAFQVVIDEEGEVILTGFPPPSVVARLRARPAGRRGGGAGPG